MAETVQPMTGQPTMHEHTEQLHETISKSMESHIGDEPHDIEHEDMEHFGQSLTDLSLPLRR